MQARKPDMAQCLPDGWDGDPIRRRSSTAATFAASLELVKQGKIDLRQSDAYAPILIRKRTPRDA